VLVTYESTDKVDSLVSFYERAIAANGMDVVNTTTSGGGTNWIFQSDSISGSVTVVPSSTNDGGTTVAISVSDTSL
jgi:hypothetical protein